MPAHAGDTVADLVARFLVERGVPIIDVRDERAAVHMVRAHAALPGQVGVAPATAGPSVITASRPSGDGGHITY